MYITDDERGTSEMLKIKYNIDIMKSLSDAGYSTYKLSKYKLISPRTIQSLRKGEMVSLGTIATVCDLLGCEPGDIIGVERPTEEV